MKCDEKTLSCLLSLVLLLSPVLGVPVSAYDADITGTGYANQTYLESYAAQAVNETELGCNYTPTSTTFKVWAPEAEAVQINFSRDTGNLANAGVDYDMAAVTVDMIPSTASDMTEGLDDYGLVYSGTTIVYQTKTSMRHYYKIIDQAKFDLIADSVTFNGEKVDHQTKDGKIYFELTNIAAADLDKPYTLTIGTNDYQYSVLDYARACLSSIFVPYATSLLVSATYWYNQAANAYFGS